MTNELQVVKQGVRSPHVGSRRVLLIAPVFPPSGEVGGLRWQKLVGLLAERNWVFDVVTTNRQLFGVEDRNRLAQLPESTHVVSIQTQSESWVGALARRKNSFRLQNTERKNNDVPRIAAEELLRQNAPSPVSQARRLLRVLDWIAFERSLVRGLFWAGREMLNSSPPELIISSGPPHPAHLAAMSLASARDIPWIMDMRDPWLHNDHIEPQLDHPVYRYLNGKHERKCVGHATRVTMNTAPAAELMRRTYPNRSDRIAAVMNGADSDPLPNWTRSEKFRMIYAGNFYVGRNPQLLFAAMKLFIEKTGLKQKSVVLQFVGATGETVLAKFRSYVSEYELDGYVEVHDYMPRDQLFDWMNGAAVMLLLQYPGGLAIPAKLFEYSRMPAWLVAITQSPNAITDVLRDTIALVADDDPSNVSAALESAWEDWKKGALPPPINSDGRFDRRRQADLMHDLMLRTCEAR